MTYDVIAALPEDMRADADRERFLTLRDKADFQQLTPTQEHPCLTR